MARLVRTYAGDGTVGFLNAPLLSARFNLQNLDTALVFNAGVFYISDPITHVIRNTVNVTNVISGGSVSAAVRTLFTSVVNMGVYNGVTGYVNGSQVCQGSIFSSFNGSAYAYIGSSSNYNFQGSIQEIIIYNSNLNNTQRQAIEAYLTSKWIPSYSSVLTTTSNMYLSNTTAIINQNLYVTSLTAATFTAQGGRSSGTPNRGFYFGDGSYVTSISDYRLKEDIHPIQDALQKVSSMQAVTYRMYRDPSQSWIGYVAQDLEVILPEVVRTDESPEGWKSIQYTNLPALIIEAVKELNDKYERIKYLLSTSS